MNFSIKQYSQLPTLKMKLYRDGRNDYNNFDSYIENALITFSMKDMKTGIYEIVNQPGQLILKDPCTADGNKEYYVAYTFSSDDTSRPGTYLGEFQITFVNTALNGYNSLITPIAETLYIYIIDSFVKTDVIFIP